MSSVAGGEFCNFGARARHHESARVFNAIIAGGLETCADRSFFSELGNVAVVLLGWAAFLLFVFVPATQLIALCLCGVALLLLREEPKGANDVNLGAALQSPA